MTKRFEGRTVVVTGAAAGLGRAIAEGFAREGAQLLLVDVDQDGLARTAEVLRGRGTRVSTHRLDLADEAAIKAFGAQACAEHPRIHALINNAGIAYGEISTGFAELPLAKWQLFFTVNSIAPVILAQALRPSLARAKGAIVNQSSMAASSPGTAYGITKATLNSMTFAMSHAFGVDGVRVNAVAPGLMETPASAANLPAQQYAAIQAQQAIQAHGTAEDIANLHVFLASDEARFITGDVVACDAGNRFRAWRH